MTARRSRERKIEIMNRREEEMFEHLARGRQLRSQAFIAAARWVARSVKSLFAAKPTISAGRRVTG